MYPANIANLARRTILRQIATRQTVHLVRCLVKWPQEERQLILKNILRGLDSLWSGNPLRFSLEF